MRGLFLFSLFLSGVFMGTAQDSSAGKKWQLSGFADVYYQTGFHTALSKELPPFIYNYKLTNRPSVNLAMLRLSYSHSKWKGNLALMAGDYARFNLAAEPRWLQHVYEANIGYQFTDKFGIEGGILPSHIGLETAVGIDCWNVSRSLLADNSPYFETGVKMNYVFNAKWTASVLLLNGWQNIKENNRSKAVGTQLVFKPNTKWVFNSSSFAGNEQPDSVAAKLRVFHNFYVTYAVHPKLNAAFLLDAGLEGKRGWWGTAAMLQYKLSKRLQSAVRAEYYNDKKGIIIQSYSPMGIHTGSISVNLDYRIFTYLSLRAELKQMNASLPVFSYRFGTGTRDNNLSLLISAAVQL